MTDVQKLSLLGMLQAIMNVSHGPYRFKVRAGYLYHRLQGRSPFSTVSS